MIAQEQEENKGREKQLAGFVVKEQAVVRFRKAQLQAVQAATRARAQACANVGSVYFQQTNLVVVVFMACYYRYSNPG